MPGMSGTDLASLLKTRYPSLGVVIASGYAELPADVGAHLTLPKLSKPFAQSDLARVVAQYARPVRVPQELRPRNPGKRPRSDQKSRRGDSRT